MRETCELDAETIRLQQEAEERVKRMRERSRRLVFEHDGTVPEAGRTAETLAAARPSRPQRARPEWADKAEKRSASEQWSAPEQTGDSCIPAEQTPACPAKAAQKEMTAADDRNEQLLLLMLAVFLMKNGGRMELILALMYLAL